MKRIIFFFTLLFLAGCATNPFVQFYQDKTGGIDLTKAYVVLSTGEPKVFRGGNFDSDHQRMLEDGYNLIGVSSFNAANVDPSSSTVQAKAVKAEVVLVYSKHTGTRSGVLPLMLPSTQTSTTNLSGNTFASDGSRSFSGTANTTTYGNQTTYIPYNVERYDYFAAYWIRMKPPMFGAYVRDLSPGLRQQIGSNKGVVVIAVTKNSPAFRSDILQGDILRKIGDLEVYDASSFGQVVNRLAGQKVTVEILRDGKEVQKEIQLDRKQ
jgi:hypothetical protein